MQDLMAFLTKQWVQLLCGLLLFFMLVHGYRTGFLRMSMSFVSIILSIVGTQLALPHVREYIAGNAAVRSMIDKRVQGILSSTPGEDAVHQKVNLFYRLTGIDRLTEALSDRLSDLILTAVTFIVLMILISLGVKILFHLLDFLMGLPGLNLINRVLGAALGLVEGIFYLWIAFLVIGILPETPLTQQIAQQLDTPGTWLYYLKEANLIVRIFSSM